MSLLFPTVRYILIFVGHLLGHCDGLGVPIWDEAGKLEAALKEAGLEKWLPTFQKDLDSYWRSREQWASLDELFALNRHFERLLWQFGIFPWKTDEGLSRIEIPLISDAQALMAAISSAAPPGVQREER